MNVIVCVDDNMGMLFNNRRQSRDQVVLDAINKICKGKKLYIHEFSQNLFKDSCEVVNNFLDVAKAGEICFVENMPLKDYVDKIETIYLFKWNRNYPYDFQLDIDFEQYVLLSTKDFKGSSHERITLEEWKYEKEKEI